MSQYSLDVKGSIIQRCPYDSQNPYTMIPNALLRDNSLSPQCRWLISYLLSNVGDWVIKPAQIAAHLKGMMGENGVYKLISEAVKSGYLRKETMKVGNLRNQIKYYVSSNPTAYSSSVSPFPCHEIRDLGNNHSQEEHQERRTSEESLTSLKVSCETVSAEADEMECATQSKPKRARKAAEFTLQVKELTADMVSTMIKHEPEYTPPKNLAAFMTEVDYMLRLDKRESDKIIEVLNWALADSFWRDKMFKPNTAKYLREKYLQLKAKMDAPAPKRDRKFAPSSNDSDALEKMRAMTRRAIE